MSTKSRKRVKVPRAWTRTKATPDADGQRYETKEDLDRLVERLVDEYTPRPDELALVMERQAERMDETVERVLDDVNWAWESLIKAAGRAADSHKFSVDQKRQIVHAMEATSIARGQLLRFLVPVHVAVFEDPYTRTRLEGCATVVKELPWNGINERRYLVHFHGAPPALFVERTVADVR